MSRVLSIDTSTSLANVALVEGGGEGAVTVAETAAPMPGSHATHLFELIDRVLADAGWPKNGLDGFVVVRGPGSFTGVRIALGTARGLAVAAGRPCAAVNTLEAMAEASGPCPASRVCLLGAGRGELYVGRYDAAGSPPDELAPPCLETAESFWATGEGFLLWGAGAEPPAGLAGDRGRPAAGGTAAAAGRIALLHGLESERVARLSPLYIRPSDAELNRRRR